jgi:hypothetical protein
MSVSIKGFSLIENGGILLLNTFCKEGLLKGAITEKHGVIHLGERKDGVEWRIGEARRVPEQSTASAESQVRQFIGYHYAEHIPGTGIHIHDPGNELPATSSPYLVSILSQPWPRGYGPVASRMD